MKTLIRFITRCMMIFLLVIFTTTGYAKMVSIQDVDGRPRGLKIADDGSQDINVQDQTTPVLILPMVQQLLLTTLAAHANKGDYSFEVVSATGLVANQHIRIINSNADRYYFGTILSVVSTTVNLDTPIDFDYIAGSEVTSSNINMAVDGDPTPIIFTLRTGAPSIPSAVDITRMIFTCVTDGLVDLTKFGDLTALTRGMVFRKVTPTVTTNIFNIKTNADLANIAYDFTAYVATNPQQGKNGFVCRLTFAGQNKMGVALRLEQNDNLEVLIQDDIDGLALLEVILEGHTTIN